jgi:hypothetical protein
MLTITELPEYIRIVEKLLSVTERLDIVNYLAAHPKAGGVRMIYYFHNEAMTLYLLTLFAKNERANISKAARNELAGLVELLVRIWLKT